MDSFVVPEIEFHQFIDTMMATIEAKDVYTLGHSNRVSEIAIEIGDSMGLDEEARSILHYGGHLHELGKVGIPIYLLNKPGALSPLEMAEIQRHPTIGATILGCIDAMQPFTDIVRYHHERFDGRGYPEGLKGTRIPLYARIVAVADALDAMLATRPYRRQRSLSEAIDELSRNAEVQFDPLVVSAVMSCPCEFQELYRIDPTPYAHHIVTRTGHSLKVSADA